MTERVEGLASAGRYIEGLPVATAHELADRLGRIGRDLLLAQKQAAAKDTGALAGSLSVQLLTERLRVRVGLLGVRRQYARSSKGFKHGRGGYRDLGGLYYGRFVEFGRIGQTVVVKRNVAARVRNEANRGKLRRRDPNKGTKIGSPYKLPVAAMAARPFVRIAGWEQRAEASLSNFWAGVLARNGGVA